MASGEVEEVGGGETEIRHLDTLGPHAVGERTRQLDAGLAHVPCHEDLGRPYETRHGPANGEAHVGVELIGHRAAHVVRFEDLVHSAHGAPP